MLVDAIVSFFLAPFPFSLLFHLSQLLLQINPPLPPCQTPIAKMPADPHENSFSSFGNSSLSTFLSTLMEDEEINSFQVVVDNARITHSNNNRSLRLLEDEPKCRWNNLVRQESDRDVRCGRKVGQSRSLRHNINRPSMANRRSVSDPSLCLQMPKRQVSPPQVEPQKKFSTKIAASSEPNLLRMPLRLQSPVCDKRSVGAKLARNATWETNKQRKKKTEKANMFLDMMMQAEDHVAKSNVQTALPTCLKDDTTLDTMSVRSSSTTSVSQASPLSDKEKALKSNLPGKPILSSGLRLSLINDLK